VAPVVEGQIARFERLYPEADLTVTPMTAREALVALVRGQADAAVVDREMNAEERRAVAASQQPFAEVKVGDGALVVVAPAARGLDRLTLEELAGALESAGTHRLALTSRNAGAVELLGERLLDGRPPRPSHRAESESDVLAWVAGQPDGLGVVSMAAWARADSALTRPLRLLALPDSAGTFVRPSQLSVYRGEYPLVQPVYLYLWTRGRPLAAPFATFVVGLHGQEEVQRAGLVPVNIPQREIELR
jgi:phosphate transport system substrate-binding protein